MNSASVIAFIVALAHPTGPRGRWKPRRAPVQLNIDGASPYQKRPYFFTRDERRFYDALRIACEGRWLVFAKVRIEDLIAVKTSERQVLRYRGHIRSSHVDFALCSLDTISPVLAIELDGDSHSLHSEQAADHNKDTIFQAAGLPLIRCSSAAAYEPGIIAARIEQTIAASGGYIPGTAVRGETQPLTYAAERQLQSEPWNSYPSSSATATYSSPRSYSGAIKPARRKGLWRRLLALALAVPLLLLLVLLFVLAVTMILGSTRPTVPGRLVIGNPAIVTARPVQSVAPAKTPAQAGTVGQEIGTTIPDVSAIVNTANLTLRSGPDKQYQALGAYPQGTTVKVLGKDASSTWLKVRVSNGKEGWMSVRFLKVGTDLSILPVVAAPAKP